MICSPQLISKKLRSVSSLSSDQSVPSTAVIVKSDVPKVVNLTSQFPPTIGNDCTSMTDNSAVIWNVCSDNCGTIQHIWSSMSFPSVSTYSTANAGSKVTSTSTPSIIQSSVNSIPISTYSSGRSEQVFTSV